ncbi:MFS general substrate transporter [Hyaloscypha bicolor E]|uniref:MFS general substrate transporter n=1 Tax=Hyaloscypha bicolor E TaxID=1095630 RepID=A0A2J6SG04_9HELO|nr:MFS general substrate transporter [Hyaloscypha bicolor E]PMD49701.1 MFS general substrate transporter [Hyaloscypha bicolor E]
MAEVKPEIGQLESHQNNAANDIEKRLEPVESNVDVQKPGIVNEDAAVGYRQYHEALQLEFSPEEVKRVRWKIDFIVLPIFLVTQALQFMDRTALNYANLFNYQKALGLKGQQFNYLSAMIYAGYFFGQYPCGWLIGRYPAQRVVGVSCLLWGVMVLALTACRTYQSALAVRFIMGIFEAAVTPGLTLMTGFWYTRREIPLRQCIWYSSLGWGGIVGSYISMGVSKLPANLKPERWELIFFILGGATCLWSFVIFFLLSDSPANSFFLTERERLIAVRRVAGNETGIKNKKFVPKQALVAFKDPKALLLFTSVFAAAIPNGVVNSFSTVIIRDMGFSTTRTTELKSVGDAVQIIALIIGGAITLNVPNSRLLTATAANILCVVAAGCMAYLPRSNTWGRLVSFWLVNAQSVGFTISLITVSSNMGGYTHRSMASAMVFTAYCWGNFAGPFVVKASEAPTYHGATIGLLVGYSIKMGCHLTMLAYMFFTNRYRDRTYGPADKEQSEEAGMQDQTEFQNKDFRYVL